MKIKLLIAALSLTLIGSGVIIYMMYPHYDIGKRIVLCLPSSIPASKNKAAFFCIMKLDPKEPEVKNGKN